MNRVRVTTAARKYGLRPSTIAAAKTKGKITDPGHGYVYEEEVRALSLHKAKTNFAKSANELARETEAKRIAASITYAEAAAFYGVNEDQVKRWKYSGRLEGPRNRVWMGMPDPSAEKPTHDAGKTRTGGAGYRANYVAPRIDPNDY